MTEDEEFAIALYRGNNYRPINNHLRKGEPGYDGMEKDISLIENAINKSEISKYTTMFRGSGMSMFPDGIENAIGSVIKDNGFISVTADEMIGRQFAAFRIDEGRDAVLWEIKLPKGIKALSIENTINLQESEFILQRGYSIRILKVYQEKLGYYPYGDEFVNKSIWRVVAEVLP